MMVPGGAAHRVVMVTFMLACGSLSLLGHLPHTHLLVIGLMTNIWSSTQVTYIYKYTNQLEQNTWKRLLIFFLIFPFNVDLPEN